jgi:hypothetical protein
MITAPDDNFRNIGEIIRKMLEQAGMSEHQAPIIFNFRIFVNVPGCPNLPPQMISTSPVRPVEPEVEVQRVDGEVKLVTELPGISPEDVQVMFSGSKVHIRAGDGIRRYQTSAEVPPAQKDSVSVTFRHGVLEVTYQEKPDNPETSVNEV